MLQDLKIRNYRETDKPVLLNILKKNVPQFFAETEVEDLSNYLDHDIDIYYVLELKDEVIGAGGINIEDEGRIGKISWDYIIPTYQGKGFGKKLLEHRINQLRKDEKIEMISVRTSQLSYQFYEKNGFILKRTIKDYWAKGYDLYHMVYKN
jgi:ribosomal protein S18 acetylase RimI-like enzyme